MGGRIVAEVLLGILNGDTQSFITQEPDWKPVIPTATGAAEELTLRPSSSSPRHRKEERMAKPRFDIYEKSGWRWKLIDSNGEVIATSEPYASASNARRSAENVKQTAPDAEIG